LYPRRNYFPVPAPPPPPPPPPSDGSTPPTGDSSSTTGQVLTASAVGSTLTGGAGADTITASMGSDKLTGGAGADRFVLANEPWSPIHITDFKVGEDKLDLSALLKKSGYAGSDPVRDGYVSFTSDGAGGTAVLFDRDGAAAGQQWGNYVVDLEHVSPSSVTWAQLTASGTSTGSTPTTPTSPTPPSTGDSSSTAGQVLTATAVGSTLTGGAGADTITASMGSDILTGGGGADRFVLAKEPWSPIHVTDFKLGEDKLDLSALLKASGYAGSDPVRDGYVSFTSDGAGGTAVLFDRDGAALGQQWGSYVVDLEHVSPSSVTWAQLAASGTSTGSTPTTPTSPTSPSTGDSSSTAGKVLTATAVGSSLVGGSGADTIIASMGSDTLTGGAGADRFVFAKEPWSPIHITDFAPGQDKLDLSALFKAAGYTGSDPIRDGYVSLMDDGHGGTNILFDRDGPAAGQQWPNYIIDLEHVTTSQVKVSDWIIS